MKSSLKVGLLAITAIIILIFTVMWVKGKTISKAERITVSFKDVNGMRQGSGVQMMGVRIGQVEEIIPRLNFPDYYVDLKFVITEPNVKIPTASEISIQQSGIIGEQFLEVTPPKIETIYVETTKDYTNIKKDDDLYMDLSKGRLPVGKVVDAGIVKRAQLPYEIRQKVKTANVIQLSYYIDLPGLILDNDLLGVKIIDGKTTLYLLDGETPQTPRSNLEYTVIEPMRLSDFMSLGYRATRAMLDTNDRINEILSDKFIADMKDSVENIRELTKNANTTLDKASKLIDTSRNELVSLIKESQELIDSLTVLSNNLNQIISDETLKKDVISSIQSVGRMSDNINKILEDNQTKEIISDVNECMRNLSDITAYVNEYTKDEKLKEDITSTVENLANITKNISNIMDDYNKLDDSEKLKLRSTVKDVLTITKNVKKFSEKLNKRFLLFRLMF